MNRKRNVSGERTVRPTELSVSKPMLADDGGFEEVLLEPSNDLNSGYNTSNNKELESSSLTPVNECSSLIQHQQLIVNRKPFKRQESVWSTTIPR